MTLARVLPWPLLFMVLLPSTASAAEKRFDWKGKLPAGGTVWVRDLKGSITVEASDRDTLHVEVIAKGNRSDPTTVKIEVVPSANGVTICALWPGDAKCEADGRHSQKGRTEDDVDVSFRVLVPRGARIDARTVNGSIVARGLGAPATLTTVNGPLTLELASRVADGDIRLTTVNGSIDVVAPAGMNADVRANTVNGGVSVRGQRYRRTAKATLGAGGRELVAETVNGSIEVR
jgi:hypothetical protein